MEKGESAPPASYPETTKTHFALFVRRADTHTHTRTHKVAYVVESKARRRGRPVSGAERAAEWGKGQSGKRGTERDVVVSVCERFLFLLHPFSIRPTAATLSRSFLYSVSSALFVTLSRSHQCERQDVQPPSPPKITLLPHPIFERSLFYFLPSPQALFFLLAAQNLFLFPRRQEIPPLSPPFPADPDPIIFSSNTHR